MSRLCVSGHLLLLYLQQHVGHGAAQPLVDPLAGAEDGGGELVQGAGVGPCRSVFSVNTCSTAGPLSSWILSLVLKELVVVKNPGRVVVIPDRSRVHTGAVVTIESPD